MSGYVANGVLVNNPSDVSHHYIDGLYFKLDVLAVLPTDILYVLPPASFTRVYVRLNRLAKLHTANKCLYLHHCNTSFPTITKFCAIVGSVLIIIHWNACFFFLFSRWIGLGSDEWVYDDSTNDAKSLRRMYLYCMYWSTLILSTIGETPMPVTNVEYLIVIISFLFGVLVFAAILGKVGDILSEKNRKRGQMVENMARTKTYLRSRHVGRALEQKIINWFYYVIDNDTLTEDEEPLQILSPCLRKEVLLRVHADDVRKINIFKNCEEALLMQLLEKFKLVVFNPGDYVFKQGDVGRDMYVVKKGVLRVLYDDMVNYCGTLKEGSVFGEISLLKTGNNSQVNRRCTTVQSVGFSELFSLSNSDLWATLEDFPQYQSLFLKDGHNLLKYILSTSDQNVDNIGPSKVRTRLINLHLNDLQKTLKDLSDRLGHLTASYMSIEKKLNKRLEVLEKRNSVRLKAKELYF